MNAAHGIVIGGGPAGLKAAQVLTKAGAQVTLLESAPVLGGLASSFEAQSVSSERYDHVISKGDDGLLETLKELGRSPAFDGRRVRFFAVFRDRYAQPICLTDYRTTTSGFATPIRNLSFADSCQLHPHDRNISGSFGLGLGAAQLAAAALGLRPPA